MLLHDTIRYDILREMEKEVCETYECNYAWHGTVT